MRLHSCAGSAGTCEPVRTGDRHVRRLPAEEPDKRSLSLLGAGAAPPGAAGPGRGPGSSFPQERSRRTSCEPSRPGPQLAPPPVAGPLRGAVAGREAPSSGSTPFSRPNIWSSTRWKSLHGVTRSSPSAHVSAGLAPARFEAMIHLLGSRRSGSAPVRVSRARHACPGRLPRCRRFMRGVPVSRVGRGDARLLVQDGRTGSRRWRRGIRWSATV
ncbi:hypothetical protein F1D59_35735 [Streptomyces sp. INR7]|nr:hypothetical protein F1D59_35735 [Streptomyces sp. INR7]